MIRNYQRTDEEKIKEIFLKQGLPENCMPDLKSKLYIVKKVVESPDGQVAMAGFVRKTCEPFLILDHSAVDPAWRWMALQDLTDNISLCAKIHGMEDATCWIPPEVVDSFAPRLESLGFVKSPWQSFTRSLR